VSPDVSIVIVTYKCREAAQACLASIYRTTSGVDFEVIVLDNASEDGTVEMVRSEFPEVRLIPSSENLGFGAGCNQAAAEARGEYVFLLNPDTELHDGAVRHLVEFAREHPENGVYGGRTLRPDGALDPGSCWAAPSVWSLFCFAMLLTSAFRGSRFFDPEVMGGYKRDTVREVDIVTGCLLFVPRAHWEALGGFDLRFFMYGEDADFSLRAREAGLRPIVTPGAVVTHEVGVSSRADGDKLILLSKGKATLLRKHWSGLRLRTGLLLLSAGAGVRALFGSARGRRGGSASAWRDVWRGRRAWLEGYPEPSEGRSRAAAPRPTV
jgi:N-acetylglucosaminyl-diphospho-decaprenol L-rhamnosyltransferase